MKIYRVAITGDKYPTEYIVQASGWGTAANRAIKEWKKRFKGSKTDKLIVKLVKGGDLLVDNNKEEE